MTSILPNSDQVNQEWKIWNQAPNAVAIAAGIKDIPAHWSLTPLQDKASKRDGWENEPFIPHAQIADLILNGEEKISKKMLSLTAPIIQVLGCAPEIIQMDC